MLSPRFLMLVKYCLSESSFYTDDMCLLVSSGIGTEDLINMRELDGVDHEMLYSMPSMNHLGIVMNTTLMDDKDIVYRHSLLLYTECKNLFV